MPPRRSSSRKSARTADTAEVAPASDSQTRNPLGRSNVELHHLASEAGSGSPPSVVEITLKPGESIHARSGSMLWMDTSLAVKLKTGGLFSAFKRMLSSNDLSSSPSSPTPPTSPAGSRWVPVSPGGWPPCTSLRVAAL